ncbi:MAG: response regulator receiver and domain protein [Blastococcus sp.]|jgi:transcriptional regulator with GAF, ATPase, and Fis domain|nr:response regulator receiver and domain protein [Blastococcus sp.]
MNGSPRLAKVFVELADTLVDEFDTVDFLQMLVDRCVELLGVDAAGLMLADQRGNLQLMASTVERSRLLQLFELQAEEGPCLECFSTGRPVVNVDLAEARDRWPRFTPAALEAGFGGTHAVPMRLRRQVIGALNLFTDRQAALDEDAVAVAQAMADVATIGLLHERTLSEQGLLSEQLQGALTSRVLIEQAKGLLAARVDISVAEAFTRMRTHARGNGVTLTAVATALVDGSLDARVLVTA